MVQIKSTKAVRGIGSSLLRLLEQAARLPQAGPAPVFSRLHVCRALLVVGEEGPIGRQYLGRKLVLGQGAIRTLIGRLKEASLITNLREGIILTPKGSRIFQRLRAKLTLPKIIDAGPLALDRVSAAMLVRDRGNIVRKGLEQRDSAVRAGATGACTLVYHRGVLKMPTDEKGRHLREDDPVVQNLVRVFNARENDVLIVVSSGNSATAEYGAYAAALTLL